MLAICDVGSTIKIENKSWVIPGNLILTLEVRVMNGAGPGLLCPWPG